MGPRSGFPGPCRRWGLQERAAQGAGGSQGSPKTVRICLSGDLVRACFLLHRQLSSLYVLTWGGPETGEESAHDLEGVHLMRSQQEAVETERKKGESLSTCKKWKPAAALCQPWVMAAPSAADFAPDRWAQGQRT